MSHTVLTRLDLRGVTDLAASLPALPPDDEPREAARALIREVREGGDAALRIITRRLDGCDVPAARVSPAVLVDALANADPAYRAALHHATLSIRGYHETQVREPAPAREHAGVTVWERELPVERAGCYVPGGRAAYPSTVLMTVIPAQVAGVREVVLCTPPGPDGEIAAATLAAAAHVGVSEVHRIGGAQAIAALTYGTETVRPVDVIVGPGNAYVAAAKREVVGTVGIDSLAGPSEVVVVCDDTVPAAFAAADLLAQAEHGPGGTVIVVTWDADVADSVDAALEAQLARLERADEARATIASGGRSVLVDGPLEATVVANAVAPEHLQLMCADAHALLEHVRNAGAVFLGPWAPAALGDYVAGVNHVLPTARTARFASALRVDTFRRYQHVVEATAAGLANVAEHAETLATVEGLGAHAESIELRRAASLARETPVSTPVAPRDDLGLMEGYHSPQLDVSVRLNTNESPYAPPPEFVERWLDALRHADLNRYPDRAAHTLRDALGKHLGQPAERIFCANGSNEVLQTLLLAYGGPGRTVVTFEPTYALHSHIARITGTAVVSGERTDAFEIDAAAAVDLIADVDPVVVFACSPNNPTGTVEPVATIDTLLDATRGFVVVDEAYGEFAPRSALERVDDDGRLVVVRTYSKVWSMAAVRLGFAVAPPWVVAQLDEVVLPYHLSVPTQEAGRVALEWGDEMADRVGRLVAERERVLAVLREIDGLTAYDSGANFVLFRVRGSGRDLWERLVVLGVLVRDCSSWPRLAECLRVTIGTHEENDAFLDAVRASMGEVAT